MKLAKRNWNNFSFFSPMFDNFNPELLNWDSKNYSSTSTTVPAVNIKENTDTFVVEVAAPGMAKEDFKITLDGNMLTISSIREEKNEEQLDKYTRREFSYQSFQRSFELQKNVVDQDNIQAQYENGLLRLTIPKKEEAKQKEPRLIEIA
ncbi:MAG: Hsp20/alpha crystallin family protein [Sphingobacterium sp.]|jgi:HSP20 family protein|nr:Hsp20/alpha crystallin family protein [Sphingobacterium sp.]